MISLKSSRKPMNLFLAEIIISLLVFSFSGAVILKVFAAADSKSRKSAELESVVITAQSIAEAYSKCADASQAVGIVLQTDRTLDLSAVPLENGRVMLNASEQRIDSGAGELCELNLRFTSNGEVLFSLNCTAYASGGAA